MFFHIRFVQALISAVCAENYPLLSEQHVFGINGFVPSFVSRRAYAGYVSLANRRVNLSSVERRND